MTRKQTNDWRGDVIAKVRALIKQACPEAIEEVKWRKPSNPAGVPAWSQGGIICTGETYKNYVKLTFAKGASLPDPARLFNSSLNGNSRRAIDIHEDDKINEKALKALVRAAVHLNNEGSIPAKRISTKARKKPKRVGMTVEEFRELALNLPEAVESEHMGHADFRVKGKIFATLGYPDAGWAMVTFNLEQQLLFTRAEPKVFRPIKGGWGKHGSTNVCLAEASEPSVRQALAAAWSNKAPKRLVKQVHEME